MSTVKKTDCNVNYPSKEWGAAFIPDDGAPFRRATIGITYPYAGYSISRREGHQVNVFEYVVSGEGEILIGDKWHRVTAGDAYILPAGIRHEYRADPQSPWEKIWINYNADYMPHMLRDYGIKAGVYRGGDVRELFEQLLGFTEAGGTPDSVHYSIAELVHGIIHRIARERRTNRGDELRIKDVLTAHIHEKLNLDTAAAELHLSKSQLIRSFKQLYGVTPYEYFIGMKIDAAKVLLRDTNMRIGEIAERLAINDEHYFSTLFRKRTGISPREYRDSKRK